MDLFLLLMHFHKGEKMKKRIIKIVATITSCIAIASNGIMIASASTNDPGWSTNNYSSACRSHGPKDDYSSVYICNDGYNYAKGRGYYYDIGPSDVKVTIQGAVEYYRPKQRDWVIDNKYDCEHYNGGYIKCNNLDLGAGYVRKIYQYVKENYWSKGYKNSKVSANSKRCAVYLCVTSYDGSAGTWSPDTAGEWYYSPIGNQ